MSPPVTVKRNAALLALFVACTAVFLTALDQTVVVTALPQVISDLQISPTHLDRAAWIVSGYLLGYVIVMPLMGRVSDIYGRRRIFVLALLIFALGSLFCGLAPQLGNGFELSFLRSAGIYLNVPANLGLNLDALQGLGVDTSAPGLLWLVSARFIQAVGGGAVVPIAMAVAGDFYGIKQRGIVLGLIGMVTEAGGVLGPLYGTLIVQLWGWQAIFYLNLPLVALLLVFVFRYLPAAPTPQLVTNQLNGDSEIRERKSSTVSKDSKEIKERIDLPGALLLGSSLVCMSLGLAQEAAQLTPQTGLAGSVAQNNPWLIAAALILLLLFIVVELWTARRRRWPIIELSLFKRPTFTAAALVSFLIGAALIIAMVDIPLFFITVLNRPELESGLALLRLTAMIPVGAVLGGWLCTRITCRWTALLGLLPTIVGFYLMHLWPLQADWTLITISTLLTGLGLGLVISPISTSAINAVHDRQLGMASSVVTVLRMIGMILGLAALTSWGLGRVRAAALSFHPPKGVTLGSLPYLAAYGKFLTMVSHDIYSAIFLAAGILCALALLPALFLQGKPTVAQLVRTTNNHNSDTRLDESSEQESEVSHGQR